MEFHESSEEINKIITRTSEKQNIWNKYDILFYLIVTFVILPNKDGERLYFGANPAATLAFSVRCSRSNKVDALDIQ